MFDSDTHRVYFLAPGKEIKSTDHSWIFNEVDGVWESVLTVKLDD